MNPDELRRWRAANLSVLEDAYLRHEEPWKQSGFSGPAERWERVRRPVADLLDAPGTFLDVGCANGYLMECVVAWARERGVAVEPYGLDVSPKLTQLARRRLPQYAERIYDGDALTWSPPRAFTYVRTELVYVPAEYRPALVARLLDEFVEAGGAILVAQCRGRHEPQPGPEVDAELRGLGFVVERVASALDTDGTEGTRVALVRKTT
jgi:SAM-dependent methyltransferase